VGVSQREERLAATVRAWQGKRILVLGDVVADELVVGVPQEIAREAPVLVLRHAESSILPGGATNVAANAAALGAQVEVCGVVGDDQTGRQLIQALQESGLGCEGVMVDPSRPTTTKTRIFAGGTQQLVQQLLLRLDRVDRRPVAGGVMDEMAAYLARTLPEIDALMISDYENGVIHPGLIAASLPRAVDLGRLVAVDSHGDLLRFRGAHLFTPNQPEAEATLGRPLTALSDLESGGRRLLTELSAQAVLITRGREGMTLVARETAATHLPATPGVTAVDPTGAGDTVAATFILAAAAGATLLEAAQLANLAAAVVVARMGTATASADDLLAAIGAGTP
jgi:rfaE bifunctional protein kinase chain/domain